MKIEDKVFENMELEWRQRRDETSAVKEQITAF